LNIELQWQSTTLQKYFEMDGHLADYEFVFMGWVADYPDPDNILRQPSSFNLLRWQDLRAQDSEMAAYYELVERAAVTWYRSERMRLYRQADRMLVAEQTRAIPLEYSAGFPYLVKPWVKYYQVTPVGLELTHKIVIEEH
jgi:ABC-type oligopeptide transport system substrate-binding subunit